MLIRAILAHLIGLSSVVCAAEIIQLRSGFTLQADCHSMNGQVLEVITGSGTLEFPMAEVQSIQAIPADPIMGKQIPSPATTENEPEATLNDAALRQGIDAAFVRSVARVESGFRQASVSRKGAIGLMQLMPATARELKVDPHLANENAQGGANYLRSLLVLYKGDSALALAAYNAGPGAVRRFGGLPPYRETRRYIAAVLKEYEHERRLQVTGYKQGTARPANRPSAID